jgi:FtsH-binding integral membrane protein
MHLIDHSRNLTGSRTEKGEAMFRRVLVILVHGLLGWALCAATMGLGMALTTQTAAMWIHLILGPVFFGLISLFYFRRFNFTSPMATALIFVGLVIGLDFFLVALVILRDLAMFRSPLGTWIPFGLIFGLTWLAGRFDRSRRRGAPTG